MSFSPALRVATDAQDGAHSLIIFHTSDIQQVPIGSDDTRGASVALPKGDVSSGNSMSCNLRILLESLMKYSIFKGFADRFVALLALLLLSPLGCIGSAGALPSRSPVLFRQQVPLRQGLLAAEIPYYD